MIGISDNLTRRYSPDQLARLFGPNAHEGEVR